MTALATTTELVASIEADALILGIIGGGEVTAHAQLPEDVRVAISAAAAPLEPSPKVGSVTILVHPSVTAKRVVLVGVGEGSDGELREAAGAASRACGKEPGRVVIALPALTSAAQAAVGEGAILGAYRFTSYLSSEASEDAYDGAEWLVAGAQEDSMARATIIAGAVAGARDLVNTAPLDLYPATFAEAAEELGLRAGLKVTVWEPQQLADEGFGGDPLRFAKDYVGVNYHNDSHSHIDALCHVAFEGKLYGGRPATSSGHETIETLKDGLVGRGVLLDIPRLRSLRWLEPGTDVHPEDLEDAEAAADVRVTPGDILLVRTGHAARLEELGPWDTPSHKSGLHPSAATFLADREVAALGSDGNNDTAPSRTEGVGFPIHVLALNAMGMHLLDYLWLEGLARSCEREGRWDFLFVCAPLRFAGGTGSPVNPIAVL